MGSRNLITRSHGQVPSRGHWGLVVGTLETLDWIGEGNRFWCRVSVEGGHRFVRVDAEEKTKEPAFDHERLARTLREIRWDSVTAVTLPFSRFEYTENESSVEFTLEDSTWVCALEDYACGNTGPVRRDGGNGARGSGAPWQAGPGQLWRNLSTDPIPSPDGRLEAAIRNYNVAIRHSAEDEWRMLSHDGTEGNTYTNRSLVGPPDSRFLAVYKVIPGEPREVHYIRSSPEDQLQPQHSTLLYAKPGDRLEKEQPVVFDVEEGTQTFVDDALFPNPFTLSELEWREDGRHLTFEYNERGHRVYRVIEVDAASGEARAVISEEPETFFSSSGKRFRRDLDDGEEIVWMSERDVWNHLYLYDGATGEVKNQITRGEWVVRGVDTVDVAARQVVFRASGMNPDIDPYFIHSYRINLDGTGLVALTRADGNHAVSFSPDMSYYVDTWSRADHPPVAKLRRMDDRSLVMELEQAMAELGFIVFQMDGMGTSHRSKAFHDVAWRDLGDAGFPDRILWHTATAAAHPEYDISGVGIFGNSAGGQNAMGALLFHPDFYKVAASTSGCHDNRMDKIWWNEQWMGWPLGPHYEASSNMVNAHRLQGRLFLLVPEMDTNVDPSSTLQVVDALIDAGKDFDFMMVPGANHGSGGDFGVRKRYDFFVRHILDVDPPAWNGMGG